VDIGLRRVKWPGTGPDPLTAVAIATGDAYSEVTIAQRPARLATIGSAGFLPLHAFCEVVATASMLAMVAGSALIVTIALSVALALARRLRDYLAMVRLYMGRWRRA
jgi:hypothetical protein